MTSCGKIAKGPIGHVMDLGLYPSCSGLSLKVINRSNIIIFLFSEIKSGGNIKI